MRNQLHPSNGASYVVKGTPLKIPVRTREEIIAEKEAQQAEIARQQLQQQEADVNDRSHHQKGYNDVLSALGIRSDKPPSSSSSRSTGSTSRLDFLNFPSKKDSSSAAASSESASSSSTSTSTSTSANLFVLQSAIQSLPPNLIIQRDSQTSGFLKKNLKTAEFAKHIHKLTGADVAENHISFTIATKAGKVPSTQIDHVGTYEVVFKLSPEISISRKVSVQATGNVSVESTSRPLNAELPDSVAAETTSPSPATAPASTPEPAAKSAKSKAFEWENDLLVNLQDKREK
ncbi:54S ribosomal protein L50, mitochondrial [Sugiyamaella lignohabitans]|uniref:54S ribosomal protein L50, mitochondrial n=1 Tax=Sugiyamaella lignohabitans TaxID=796027 RepID=A0A161HHB2_9ASCO|nr:54S ribosomal protein L50, mitochondrial [Sugiyamaella lignohabitans]ANB11487.1 54S ribosomal protein L50, mitochondrial [Sugiyamaella lignohabitans]